VGRVDEGEGCLGVDGEGESGGTGGQENAATNSESCFGIWWRGRRPCWWSSICEILCPEGKRGRERDALEIVDIGLEWEQGGGCALNLVVRFNVRWMSEGMDIQFGMLVRRGQRAY
jgi:hypothetical protein